MAPCLRVVGRAYVRAHVRVCVHARVLLLTAGCMHWQGLTM